ncbi:methyl-accepting chemotaxis protein [Siminovitchia acidinfaciens]|uniref:Methyl-accepting chemotaxis protein n=1 Tax=Siminovitchia acidinfaciens TaxID=2321395 RepID=A0A429Y8L0_9BACI|nr:methyl-accepting chemotaxis protein [Siminovitchia acidinfaciens]RST77765.1 methyl-accepting chemotaxis protein [Siminovitchia acidinfaciens]
MNLKKLFNWFLNLKIGVKLTSAFLIIALFQVGTGIIALSQMSKINEEIEKIYSESLIPGQELGEARNLVQQLRLSSQDLYLYPNEVDKKTKEIEQIREKIDTHIEAYSKSHLTEEQKVKMARFNNQWESHNISYDQAVQLALDGKSAEYLLTLNGGLLKFQNKMFEELNELMKSEAILAAKGQKAAEKTYLTTLVVTIGIISLIFILSIVFGIVIARGISQPLRQLVDLVEKVAEGDLSETTKIHMEDEVGALAHSTNKMIKNLRETIQNILNAAENLSASSEQVSASTEEIANASTSQSNATQTMNELFKELSGAISSIAQNTEDAAGLALKTIKIAEDGEKVVQSSVEGAGLISLQMSRLEEGSRKIGEIIGVIDEIADQTNLLALNAAIEAARAGEQGRGFAVVADEVRKLADRSAEATNEISSIVKNMQEATFLSITSVEEGAAKTQKSREAFEKIISMINRTGDRVTEIASASEEQAAQSSEVLSHIESISFTTEKTAASSEETASTANALTGLAGKLNAVVAGFRLN